jgi:hypothetical protein
VRAWTLFVVGVLARFRSLKAAQAPKRAEKRRSGAAKLDRMVILVPHVVRTPSLSLLTMFANVVC